jgi:hypothetical protein
MEEKSLMVSRKKEIDTFVENKSVLDIVDTILYLDTIKLYVPLSHNGEVGELLQKRSIPVVHSKEDFDYLYQSLMGRIDQLDGKDERVKTYLQHANYQRQMTELPALMSKLERVALKFDVLKEPFKEVMKYVYSTVRENEINVKGREVELPKKIEIPKMIFSIFDDANKCDCGEYVDEGICLIIEPDKKWKNPSQHHLNEFFHFHMSPVYESIIHNEMTERRTLFGKKVKRVSYRTKELKDVNIARQRYEKDEDDDIICQEDDDFQSGEFIDYLVKEVRRGEIKRENFLMTIKMMINLPTIINNNLNNSERELNNLFSEIQKDLVPQN